MSNNIRVKLAERSYDIKLTTDNVGSIGSFAKQFSASDKAFIVTDVNVRSIAEQVATSLGNHGFKTHHSVRPSGEGQKSLVSASELYDALAEFRADRKSLVVAVGGGVVGDLAGFVAATFNRGMPLLMIPTTLLAMVDSSVGGKTAVNHPRGKNLIGAFHQPVGVFISLDCLKTLPDREYVSGLAEVVKYGVILDAELFAYLEENAEAIMERKLDVLQHIVARCCELKADVVEKDEKEETGLRAVLNYGHTFAHGFESVAGYGSWLHGEAVAAGMICASRLAERRGLISADDTERQINLVRRFQLPIGPERWPVTELIDAMQSDKKAMRGSLRFILPTKIGAVELFDDIPTRDVEMVLKQATAGA